MPWFAADWSVQGETTNNVPRTQELCHPSFGSY